MCGVQVKKYSLAKDKLIRLQQKAEGGVTVEWFIEHIMRWQEEVGGLVERKHSLPDSIHIRVVKDLEALPQGRCNFGDHTGARTTVTTIPIDHKAGRKCK